MLLSKFIYNLICFLIYVNLVDMNLSVAEHQVREMLQQAEDCTEDNPDTCIMIGNLSTFTRILAQLCEQRATVPMSTSHSLHCNGKENNGKIGSKRMAYQVFLGGSCNPTTWRSEIAIPTLQRLGITYYNPQVSQWGPELIAEEYEAKETAQVLLFVIDNQTRNTAGIIEAAQLAATRSHSLVLVVYHYQQNQTILGETISALEYCDLMNGLLVLEYLTERQGIPIFESISGALNGTSKILREAINVQDLNHEDGIKPTRKNGIDTIKLKEVFGSIDVNDTGTVRLEDAWRALQSSIKCNMSMSELFNAISQSDTYESVMKNCSSIEDLAGQQINLEQFWALANEWMQRFKNNIATCEDWTQSHVPDSEKCDLYIGVVGKDHIWLESSAIPLIESVGLSLNRPSANDYTVMTMPLELQRMKSSRVILLVLPQHSRGVAIAALAAHLIGLRAKLVLCIQLMPDGCVVSGEQLTEQATKDYNRGRMYLSDYAKRENVPVFQKIADALQHAIKLVQSWKKDGCSKLLRRFVCMYWKTLVLIIWPLILLPLIIINNERMYKCLYVIAIMAMYWVTESLPLPITGMIPVVLYPLLGILNTGATCDAYINDTTLMFLGSLIIAVVIENSGLHMRVALLIIKLIGCSHRKLSLGLFYVTMFISMWISNTAATAMMIPIIETVLVELEAQGLGDMFVFDDIPINQTTNHDERSKRPTRSTMVYYLSASYASSIGGIGTIVGSGVNLTLKGLYEERFDEGPGINFASWMIYAVPPMLIMGFLTWLWLQIMYMGLFRPKSQDARAINIGEEGEKVAKSVIDKRYRDLGPVTWYESIVAFLFLAVVLLWFFRKPGFVRGWPTYITDLPVKDSTAVVGVIILLFIIPSKLDFLRAFDKDPSKRPTRPSPALIDWKTIHQKMHWSLIFVLGGGFAIAIGSKDTGLSKMLGEALGHLRNINSIITLFIVCLFAEIVTELTANVAVANIIVPVLAEMCVSMKVHPLYLMLPVALCCSFSFHLPVGTPPNAIVSAASYIRTKDFIIAGIGPTVITLIVICISWTTWGVYIFDLHEFPSWAHEK
ncbi:protein I'm not dead yet [Cotesia typhae]|uniref:protein I'm not dead yet n=1 Tax=Cotesia typhae TaxID=2053667 RepID=UPI003D68426B